MKWGSQRRGNREGKEVVVGTTKVGCVVSRFHSVKILCRATTVNQFWRDDGVARPAPGQDRALFIAEGGWATFTAKGGWATFTAEGGWATFTAKGGWATFIAEGGWATF
jgi:hypothetical protein